MRYNNKNAIIALLLASLALAEAVITIPSTTITVSNVRIYNPSNLALRAVAKGTVTPPSSLQISNNTAHPSITVNIDKDIFGDIEMVASLTGMAVETQGYFTVTTGNAKILVASKSVGLSPIKVNRLTDSFYVTAPADNQLTISFNGAQGDLDEKYILHINVDTAATATIQNGTSRGLNIMGLGIYTGTVQLVCNTAPQDTNGNKLNVPVNGVTLSSIIVPKKTKISVQVNDNQVVISPGKKVDVELTVGTTTYTAQGCEVVITIDKGSYEFDELNGFQTTTQATQLSPLQTVIFGADGKVYLPVTTSLTAKHDTDLWSGIPHTINEQLQLQGTPYYLADATDNNGRVVIKKDNIDLVTSVSSVKQGTNGFSGKVYVVSKGVGELAELSAEVEFYSDQAVPTYYSVQNLESDSGIQRGGTLITSPSTDISIYYDTTNNAWTVENSDITIEGSGQIALKPLNIVLLSYTNVQFSSTGSSSSSATTTTTSTTASGGIAGTFLLAPILAGLGKKLRKKKD